MKRLHSIILLITALIIFAACSTTRVLQDGEYRLAKNRIIVEDESKEFNVSKLEPYLKQKPPSAPVNIPYPKHI